MGASAFDGRHVEAVFTSVATDCAEEVSDNSKKRDEDKQSGRM